MGSSRFSRAGSGFISRRGAVLAAILVIHAIVIAGLWNTGHFERERPREQAVEVLLLSERLPDVAPSLPLQIEAVRPADLILPQIQVPVDTVAPTAITAAPTPVSAPLVAADANGPAIIDDVEYLYQGKPHYPPKAKRARQQGIVYLLVLIDEDGNPRDVRVYRSSGFEILDAAAREAVCSFRFRPHRINGVARSARAIVPIQFSLANA